MKVEVRCKYCNVKLFSQELIMCKNEEILTNDMKGIGSKRKRWNRRERNGTRRDRTPDVTPTKYCGFLINING